MPNTHTLSLALKPLDHVHMLAKWDDWSVFKISLANEAERGKHTSSGVFHQSHHRRYSGAHMVGTEDSKCGRGRQCVMSLVFEQSEHRFQYGGK